MPGDDRQIVAVLAQGRHVQPTDVEAIQQVGAEAAGRHFAVQVAVGGREHAHVDLGRAVRTDTLHLPLLQRAQQLRLHVQRQFADLVEEQTGPVGDLELAEPVRGCTRERALAVAEQFALDDRLGQCRAIHVHQHLVAPRRLRVQRAHHQFLADARLAGHQHREMRTRDQLHLVAQSRHRRAVADQHAALPLEFVAHQLTGREPVPHRAAFERFDQLAGAQGRRGQRRQRRQELVVESVEAIRRQRVERQQTDQSILDAQRTTEARVHPVAQRRFAFDQAADEAVVRIVQLAVGREPGRPIRTTQDVEPRLLTAAEAVTEQVGSQADAGDRHQLLAVQAQDADRVARESPVDRLGEALGTVAHWQRARHVERDAQQESGVGFGCHLHTVL